MFYVFTKKPFVDSIIYGPKRSFDKDFVLNNSNYNKGPAFISAIYSLFPNTQPISIVEYGCGIGSLIEDVIIDEHIAIGIDGFFPNKKFGVGAFGRFPNNFFCADLEQPLTISYDEYCDFNYDNPMPYLFDVATTSEFMEHLKPSGVNQCCETIAKHLKINGILIAEISTRSQGGHLTLENREWWINKFKEYNLVEDIQLNNLFNNKYYRNLDDSHKFCFRKQ
jgi:SAM-dependent methyltransferase